MSTTLITPQPLHEAPLPEGVVVPDHPGSLVEAETPHEPAPPAPTPNPMPWVIAAVAVVAWLIGFALGILAVGTPAPRIAYEGWAPTEYGLAMEHLAQAPVTSGAEYGLLNEHLAQVPVGPAAISLAQEHLAQAPVNPAAVSLANEHLAQAP